MMPHSIDTIIIGAGLSGMYAARLLSEKNISFIILEGRDRIGGRILSPDFNGFSPDLGPSWYWPDINPRLQGLIKEFDLKGYPQYDQGLGRFEYAGGLVRTVRGYPAQPASWRIHGGMKKIITALFNHLHCDVVHLNSPVCEIKKNAGGALVTVGELGMPPLAQFSAARVILAIPPRLAAATILFTPDLSHQLTQAMLKTGTWMAGQAKFYAIYENSFWRQSGLSGQAFSQQGPLGEIHDGSCRDQRFYGLTGFVNIPAAQRIHEQDMIKSILSQLAAIYGEPASRPLTCYYQDWAREKFTATPFDQPPMHEHPEYQPPAGQTSIWDYVIHFAGSETADRHGGYLEGALDSARRAVNNLKVS